jgi:hypothetical protein
MAEVIGVDVPDGEDDTTTTTVPTTTTMTSTTIETVTSTAPSVGTTLLRGAQEAGEDKPEKPEKPEKPGKPEDDRGNRGRGRAVDPDDEDDRIPPRSAEAENPSSRGVGSGSVERDDEDLDDVLEPGAGGRVRAAKP